MVHMENSMIRVLSICILLLFSTTVSAYELLMYSNKHCGYCVKFIKEVVPTYEYKTPSGYMELTIIERGEEPQWFITAYIENRIKPLKGTPTFIIWNGRKELARLIGYSNKEAFYNRLDIVFE